MKYCKNYEYQNVTQRQEVSKGCWKKMAPIDFLVLLELTSPLRLVCHVVYRFGL